MSNIINKIAAKRKPFVPFINPESNYNAHGVVQLFHIICHYDHLWSKQISWYSVVTNCVASTFLSNVPETGIRGAQPRAKIVNDKLDAMDIGIEHIGYSRR